jgi:hypothetical protein
MAKKFQYIVTVETDTQAHADQVMAERLGYDEGYEDAQDKTFDYSVPFAPRESCAACNSWYDV